MGWARPPAPTICTKGADKPHDRVAQHEDAQVVWRLVMGRRCWWETGKCYVKVTPEYAVSTAK
jgi:hypothetical protein